VSDLRDEKLIPCRRALARALQASDAQRTAAVRDALAFRDTRRMLYNGSAEKERPLEIHEGIASYAGNAAATDSVADAIDSALEALTGCSETGESFVRAFAYFTAYDEGLTVADNCISIPIQLNCSDGHPFSWTSPST
jgi:hypothetical protein